jgi:tRNA U34 5-carboxymethylaminomethyl modifying GTPase MnmE/TrmE
MCRGLHFHGLGEAAIQMRLGPTGLIEVVSPFDAVTQAQLRALRPSGRWLQARGCWEFPLEAAVALLGAGEPPELVAVELRSALGAVGEVVGEAGTEEILGKIFSSFCIGK